MSRHRSSRHHSCLLQLLAVVNTICGVLLVNVNAQQSCIPGGCTSESCERYDTSDNKIKIDCCLSLMEEVPEGTEIGYISEFFPSHSFSSFSFIEHDDTPIVAINSSGFLTTLGRIDRDQGPTATCERVSLQDATSAFITLAIEIVDINDNAPNFTADQSVLEVEETPANVNVLCDEFPVAADADDSSVFGNVMYTMVGGNATSYLTITDGPCFHTIKTLDREELAQEATPSLFATIMATDGGGLSSTIDVTISVLDICDNAPVFQDISDTWPLPLPETEPNGSIVWMFKAHDQDEGTNAEFHFELETSATILPFQIDANTGNLRLIDTLNWEDTNSREFTFTVKAVDTCGMSNMVQGTIEVQDINEPAVFIFTPENKTEFDILEGTTSRRKLLAVEVIDEDGAGNQEFNTTLVTGEEYFTVSKFQNIFSISQSSNHPLDRETKDKVDVRVMVMQLGVPVLYDWINITVNVLDVNDNLPELNLTHFYLEEHNQALARIVQLSTVAFDRDAEENGTIDKYELISVHRVPDGFNFTQKFIDVNSNDDTLDKGILVMPKVWDREGDGEFLNISVQMTDGGGQSVVRDILLEITDINDERPQFNQTSYEFELMENLDPGSPAGRVFATDRDKGINSTVIYSLSPPSVNFEIDNSTGEIRNLVLLDREDVPEYVVYVTARDMGVEPLSTNGTVKVTINVGDEDDNVPRFDPDIKTLFPVAVNAGMGTVVTTVTATDADVGTNAEIAFKVEPDIYFHINASTGDISVARDLELGLENITVYAYSLGSDSNQPPDELLAFSDKLNITIQVVEASEESGSTGAVIYIVAGAGLVVVLGIVVISAIVAFILCRLHRRKGGVTFQDNTDGMNNYVMPRKSSIKPPSNGDGTLPPRKVQFQPMVSKMYYDSKDSNVDGTYKVEDLIPVSDGESPRTAPRHMNGSTLPAEGHSNGIPPQFYDHTRQSYSELELSESTTDEPNNYDGQSDDDSSDDNASHINAQITHFEDRVPSLGTPMRYPNAIAHPSHYQHNLSPVHPIPPLSTYHHHSGSLTLTPNNHSHSLSSHASTPPVHQMPPSILPGTHILPRPQHHIPPPSHLHALAEPSYPLVMPRALSGGERSPPPAPTHSAFRQPPPFEPFMFVDDVDACTYESSVLDEELEFNLDVKPDFISLTATDFDEETDQL